VEGKKHKSYVASSAPCLVKRNEEKRREGKGRKGKERERKGREETKCVLHDNHTKIT